MIVLEQGLNGCDEGLNGLNLKKAFKKIRIKDVSLKNVSKVARAGAMLGVGIPPHIALKQFAPKKVNNFIDKNIRSAKRDISIKNAIKVGKAGAMLGVGIPPHIALKQFASKAVNTGAMRGVVNAPRSAAERMCCCPHDEGLNGWKIGKFIKRNVKSIGKDVSIKNAIKVGKVALPIALSIIPVVGGSIGGVVGKVLSKVTTNADGTANLVGRIVDGVEKVANSNVGKSIISLAKPLVKNATASILQQNGEIPNDEQLATLADAKGTTPQQELDAMVTAKTAETAKTATPTAEPKKDNTMLIVGGVAAVGIAYAVFK